MAVEIRTWREGDDAELSRLWGPLTGWCSPERYERKFDDPGVSPEHIFVAELDGRVVGHALACQRTVFCEGRWRLFGGVGHLIVHPVAKGYGIGRRLLAACDDVHERGGVRAVLMWTKNTYQPAYSMYLRNQFELHAQRVHHEVDLEWVVGHLGQSPLVVKSIPPEDADAATAIRERWAHEAFPVSIGWDVQALGKPSYGYYEGDKLVGVYTYALSDPILPGRDVREAIAASAQHRLERGERIAHLHCTANGAADRALTPLAHGREESNWCTLIKYHGPPVTLGGQEPVHGGVWPW